MNTPSILKRLLDDANFAGDLEECDNRKLLWLAIQTKGWRQTPILGHDAAILAEIECRLYPEYDGDKVKATEWGWKITGEEDVIYVDYPEPTPEPSPFTPPTLEEAAHDCQESITDAFLTAFKRLSPLPAEDFGSLLRSTLPRHMSDGVMAGLGDAGWFTCTRSGVTVDLYKGSPHNGDTITFTGPIEANAASLRSTLASKKLN